MPITELAMDALALLTALRAGGRTVAPERVLLGAAAGTLVSLTARRLALSRTATAALWLPTALAMSALAGGGASLRAAARLLLSTALLGGLTAALAGPLGSLPAARAVAALCVLAALCAGRRSAEAARVFIRFKGRQAAFPALADSGNRLRDYLTGFPVIVLPEGAAREALGLVGAALRPIVAQTAGGRAMMWCFVPEEAAVFSGGRARRVRAAVALSPGMPGDAPALIPSALMEERR